MRRPPFPGDDLRGGPRGRPGRRSASAWLSDRALVLLVLVATAAALLVPTAASAPAAPPWSANKGQLDQTVAFLQHAQNADGGFGGRVGGASDPIFSSWVAMALAAGGINPQDQKAPGGTDVYAYIEAQAAKLSVTTDFERAWLAAISAGASPADFGGRDLPATVLARQNPDGSFPHHATDQVGGINDTVFAILPLSTVGNAAAADAIARAARWLKTVQGTDGGWSYAPGLSESSDMTGAVIQALHAAGQGGGDVEQRAWSYLHTVQRPDGGFAQTPDEAPANSASTAWVVQAMWAAGVDPTTWSANGHSPLDYLVSLMQPDGSVHYRAGESNNDVWMTAYVAPALAGYPYPVPTVPRASPVSSPDTAPAGAGVTAGGGGSGAPLFSRAQPQSHGDASGGVRQVKASPRANAHRAASVTRTRRAPHARKTTTGTAQSNGVAADGVTPVASAQRTHGGTSPEKDPPARSATKRSRRDRAAGGNGSAPRVTGRLLGRAPAGVSGRGTEVGAAPGLRSASPPTDSSAASLVVAVLLAAALLGGAGFEASSPKEALVP